MRLALAVDLADENPEHIVDRALGWVVRAIAESERAAPALAGSHAAHWLALHLV